VYFGDILSGPAMTTQWIKRDMIRDMPETGSPLATQIISANPHAYQTLVIEGAAPPLAYELLNGIKAEQLLATPAGSLTAAQAMLAGLWLWHDGLEECHRIVQGSPLPPHRSTFAFWHAIMHRREGDFSNSKYWYARTDGHPALQTMTNHAGSIVNPAAADNSLLRLIAGEWNANAFVDLVESVHRDQVDPRHRVAVQLQQLEWRLLFEHCARAGN
jgi:hypothetical protein